MRPEKCYELSKSEKDTKHCADENVAHAPKIEFHLSASIFDIPHLILMAPVSPQNGETQGNMLQT